MTDRDFWIEHDRRLGLPSDEHTAIEALFAAEMRDLFNGIARGMAIAAALAIAFQLFGLWGN